MTFTLKTSWMYAVAVAACIAGGGQLVEPQAAQAAVCCNYGEECAGQYSVCCRLKDSAPCSEAREYHCTSSLSNCA
jgi:hypothetical protein